MNNKYNIGDEVYHVTPESDKGVVVDWRYNAYSGIYGYFVTWGPKDADWYVATELSETKVFESGYRKWSVNTKRKVPKEKKVGVLI